MGKLKGRKNITTGRLSNSTLKQSRDTGLTLVLIFLLLVYFCKLSQLIPVSIILLLLTMICPNIFRPMAWFWFWLSHFTGTIVSNIILSIIFLILVTPIGFLRRFIGADALQLKRWKKSKDSVFVKRNHKILEDELTRPY